MIGQRLGELRKEVGLKQAEFAEMLGLSLHTIKSYEQNKTEPDDATKIQIARILNVSIDYLVGLIDDPIPLVRVDRVDLPRGFPKELIPKAKEFVNLLLNDHMYKTTKRTTRL
jgi:transcriptional regulator with XRE-family HTH domain